MKKQTKSIWQNISIALIVSFVLVCQVTAQSELKFNALYNCPDSSIYNFKVLDCADGRYCNVLFVNVSTPSASFKSEVLKSKITDAFKTGGCTIDGKKLEAAKDEPQQESNRPNNQMPQENNRPNNDQQNIENNKAQTGRFKVGDRVKACPMQMENCNDYWENCTIVKDMKIEEGADSYQVLCDDSKGGKGTLSYVPTKFVRGGAPPPPATLDCQFNEPAGTVSKTSKPSAELFKRVIFEQYRDKSNGRKVGITYQTFTLGKSYVSRLGNGNWHDGAPQGATIYPVKTKFIFCDKYTDSTIRWEYEAQYSCFKDKFGDWACPSDATKISEPIYLPNK